jgi:hypothetical protein
MHLSAAFALFLTLGTLPRPIHISIDIEDASVPSIPQPMKFRQSYTFMFKERPSSNPISISGLVQDLCIQSRVSQGQDPNKCRDIKDGNRRYTPGGQRAGRVIHIRNPTPSFFYMESILLI